ncbi:MAG: AIPR family protein, partial [Chitinophagaceae bacterium]|nr:AIPR family protein [Chitinophagaceae bacterium]
MSNKRIILEGCINQFKTQNELELKDSEIFELFTLTQISKSFDLSFENLQNSIVDGGNDGGIDSVLVLIDDKIVESVDALSDFSFSNRTYCRFVISQCKKENSFKEGPLDKLITTFPALFDLEKTEADLLKRFNADLVALTILVNKAWQQTAIHGGKVQVDINYACNAVAIEINQIFENKVNQLIQVTKQIFSTNNVCYSNYSCSELLELYQQSKTYRLTLEFKDPPLSTNYAEHGIGYVGMVRLYEYKKFLTSENSLIRDDLFESNIRHFQGDVDVNRKIRRSIETIDNKDFWWLNNGITIIAESPSQIGKKLVIENVQIVNGLQTSYSIFSSHSGDSKDERSVLVKVIINNNKETIDAIIASTNSQNPVSSTLLRATEKTQRDLEIFFST